MMRCREPIFLVVLVLLSGLMAGCAGIRVRQTPTPTAVRQVQLTKERVIEFGARVWSVEKDRSSLYQEHQAFSKEFSELAPAVVLDTMDSTVRRFRQLEQRLLDIPSPDLEMKRVHTKFIVAYSAEHKAYVSRRSWVYSLLTPTEELESAEEQLHEATKLFYQAEILLDEAYDELNVLLIRFGATWSDITGQSGNSVLGASGMQLRFQMF